MSLYCLIFFFISSPSNHFHWVFEKHIPLPRILGIILNMREIPLLESLLEKMLQKCFHPSSLSGSRGRLKTYRFTLSATININVNHQCLSLGWYVILFLLSIPMFYWYFIYSHGSNIIFIWWSPDLCFQLSSFTWIQLHAWLFHLDDSLISQM